MRLPKQASKAIVLMGLIALAIFFFMLKQMELSLSGVGGIARTVFYGILFLVGFFVVMRTIFRI